MAVNRRTATTTAAVEALIDEAFRDIADHELLDDLIRRHAPEAHPVGQMA